MNKVLQIKKIKENLISAFMAVEEASSALHKQAILANFPQAIDKSKLPKEFIRKDENNKFSYKRDDIFLSEPSKAMFVLLEGYSRRLLIRDLVEMGADKIFIAYNILIAGKNPYENKGPNSYINIPFKDLWNSKKMGQFFSEDQRHLNCLT